MIDGVKSWKIGMCENSKNIGMDGAKLEWFAKSNNSGINLTRRPHEEEEGLCKLMINGVARHHRERDALLATGDGENLRVQFVDDITGKELPWSEVRQVREHELKHLRDFGVFSK